MSARGADISVLLVTHNHEKYVERAIASIESQLTDRSVEVVVADDLSTDATLDLLGAWAKRSKFSVRVLPKAEHLGITRNYARGFAACAGTYVAVLEGDDEWIAVDKLERQAAVLDANRQLSMVANRVLLYDEDSGDSRVIPLIGHDRFLTEVSDRQLAVSNWFATFTACMYRRSVLEKLDPAVFETTAYDWLVNMAVTAHGNAGLLPEVMSLYRQHSAGEWSRKKNLDRDLQLQSLIPQYTAILGDRVSHELSYAATQIEKRIQRAMDGMAPGKPATPRGVTPLPIPRVERADAPRVSVVMAAYNHAPFILEAVESVLAQTERDLELIVVDDGSRDRSMKAIATVNDPRLRIYRLGVNQGGAAALNVAIQQSRSRLIAVINSDDAWEPTKLERQLEVLDARPEVGAVFTDVRLVGPDSRPLAPEAVPAWSGIFRQENRSQGAWLRRFFADGNCLCHPSVLIRREYYEKYGLMDNRLRQIPDLQQWITLVKHYPIVVLDEQLVRFRLLPDHANASSGSEPNIIRGVREHLDVNERFFDDCSDELLLDGFGDDLRDRDFHTPQERACAIAFLWLDVKSSLHAVNRVQGLRELRALLGEPESAALLLKRYAFTDLHLHDLARRPDSLPAAIHADWVTGGSRPRQLAELNELASGHLLRVILVRKWRAGPLRWPRRAIVALRVARRGGED
jgi:glycosyltransferase involved in cell wall biosynthesis